MNAQFPAHCEVLASMTTDKLTIAIYRDRLTEQLNQLADLKFQMAESIDNHGHKELEPAYRQLQVAYTSVLVALKSIAQ